jgi:hypothetical protein
VRGRYGHVRSLATSTALSEYYVPQFKAPLDVIRILNAAGVRFVLIGTHALGGWMNKPRTTSDVDVLVAARGHKKAVGALLNAFPDLEPDNKGDVTQLRQGETKAVLIEVMKPSTPLLREGLKHTHTVEAEGHVYHIPTLEMALAMKFARLIDECRDQADRFQDAHDFLCMIHANLEIDLRQLAFFGELVYNAGGAEIVEMVRKVRTGEKLTI